MFRRALCVVGVCIFAFSPAPSASAQEVGASPLPLVEASAGYAFMRDTTIEGNFPAGWYFSTAANLNHWIGLAGEITGAHKKMGAVDYRRIVFTDADEFDADDSQVRAIAGVVFGWGAQ